MTVAARRAQSLERLGPVLLSDQQTVCRSGEKKKKKRAPSIYHSALAPESTHSPQGGKKPAEKFYASLKSGALRTMKGRNYGVDAAECNGGVCPTSGHKQRIELWPSERTPASAPFYIWKTMAIPAGRSHGLLALRGVASAGLFESAGLRVPRQAGPRRTIVLLAVRMAGDGCLDGNSSFIPLVSFADQS